MICKSCAQAADLITMAREEGGSIPITAQRAKVLHAFCASGTSCDCQHIIDFEGKRTINGRS